MAVLSEETVSMSGSHFADGIEFEETFPEPVLEASAAHEPAPRATLAPHVAATDATEALYQEQLERRLREAESLVKQTIERMRLEEEQRLVAWVQDRHTEEERRLATWADERRAAIERSMEQRTTHADGLAERLQAMLVEWQDRFEQRLERRRVDEERLAERRRISDDERLRQWRAELEKTLTERFAQRHAAERAPVQDRGGDVRPSLRDAVAATTSARDVGRLLRDVLAEITHTAAYALAVHHTDRDEVAYRYRVASDDELGASLRHDALDDGPQSAAAHAKGWTRAQRAMRVGSRNVTVHTAQVAVRAGDRTVGVLTLQSESDAIADSLLARVDELVAVCAPHLATLRDNGSYRAV